ncbi:MAG: FAD-binding oxidoreductase [Actinomycetota bacterium]
MNSAETSLANDLADLRFDGDIGPVDALIVVAPPSIAEIAQVITVAASHGASIVPVGSGSTLAGSTADIALSTHRLAGIIDYQPDDLTIVVGAGTRLVDLEAELAERWHTAILPERSPGRTVGGVVASGTSGYRRLKYGPTRDRVLEVTMATGYGEVVRAGGRLVKNVTGYDIPRLVTGSLGSLGIIGSVCLKLWPAPPHRVTVGVEDPVSAVSSVYKPVAVLESETGSFVYLEGDETTVAEQAGALGGTGTAGFAWPETAPTPATASLRVPARHLAAGVALIGEIDTEWFVAQHGVGVIDLGLAGVETEQLGRLRRWAESRGGSLVVASPGLTSQGRWGTPPSTLPIQRRMKNLFDPFEVCHPGALPGGI